MSKSIRFISVAGVVALGSLAQATFINSAAPAAQQGPSASQAAFPASETKPVIMTGVVANADALASVPMGLHKAAIYSPKADMGVVANDTDTGVGIALVPAPGVLAGLGIAALAGARRRR